MSLFVKGEVHGFEKIKGDIKKKTPALKADVKKDPTRIGVKLAKNPISLEIKLDILWKTLGATAKQIKTFFCFISAKVSVRMKKETDIKTFPASIAKSPNNSIDIGLKSQVINSPAKEVRVDGKPGSNGFALLVAYGRAALSYFYRVLMQHESGLCSAKGAVAKFRKIIRPKRKSKAQSCDSEIIESRYNKFSSQKEATATYAPIEPVSVQSSFFSSGNGAVSFADSEKIVSQARQGTTHTAKITTWTEPYVDNGVLILRQAHTATQTGDVLEVR